MHRRLHDGLPRREIHFGIAHLAGSRQMRIAQRDCFGAIS